MLLVYTQFDWCELKNHSNKCVMPMLCHIQASLINSNCYELIRHMNHYGNNIQESIVLLLITVMVHVPV